MQIKKCPVCSVNFAGWPEYHEHLNLFHGVASQAKDIRKREYVRMNPDTKREIVLRFEKRLSAAIIGMFFICFTINAYAEPPAAGWNFGHDTYADHSGQLILNSLSDRYGISTFETPTQSLGTNDYIPENGVKNVLALDGYTHAYDFNPNSQTGYGYSSIYNQPLPNVPLTKLTFMGLDGDPTKAQDVYVLTSEYNTLSAQGQATSINALSNGLVQVNAQTLVNTQGITALNVGLTDEIKNRQSGDSILQSQLNATNENVSAVQNRVSNLERLKVMPEADIRFFDSKHVSAFAYDAYDSTNGRNFAIGVKVMLKLGKSYEERILEKQQKTIERLENIMGINARGGK